MEVTRWKQTDKKRKKEKKALAVFLTLEWSEGILAWEIFVNLERAQKREWGDYSLNLSNKFIQTKIEEQRRALKMTFLSSSPTFRGLLKTTFQRLNIISGISMSRVFLSASSLRHFVSVSNFKPKIVFPAKTGAKNRTGTFLINLIRKKVHATMTWLFLGAEHYRATFLGPRNQI